MKVISYCLISLLLTCIQVASFCQDRALSTYNSSQPEVSASSSITLLPGFFVPYGSVFRAYISSFNTTPLASSLSQDQNYIVTYTPRQPFTAEQDLSSKTVGEVTQSVQYFDGLGRPLQTVQTKGSPDTAEDVVVPMAYDEFGREAKKYLPYASSSNNGSYKPSALTEVISYYNSPQAGMSITFSTPFSKAEFEPSPLHRVIEQGSPGNSWQPAVSGISGSGHTVKTEYTFNKEYEIRRWYVYSSYQFGVWSCYI